VPFAAAQHPAQGYSEGGKFSNLPACHTNTNSAHNGLTANFSFENINKK
jgi:hypothetical protein